MYLQRHSKCLIVETVPFPCFQKCVVVMVLAVKFKHFYVNDAISVSFCVFFRPHSPDEVSKCFIMINFTIFCGDTVQRNNKPVHHVFTYGRGTPFRFRLSISVGPGIPSESPVRHYVSQPGVPARSHPCLFWTWSSETVTAAEVSPSWGSVNLTHDFAYCCMIFLVG